ncbi:MAG: TIGR01777 family oxidoreductase [Lewinella sp.]|nr:TIGR01777 family oxidoreductase [Lewinella sp.]
MATILIGGGSGLIGTRLSAMLQEAGHEVRHLSRRVRTQASFPTFQWNIKTGDIDGQAFDGVDIVINLAGAGIADGRWTESRKQLIISSRTDSTRLLQQAIQAHGHQVKAYLAGSAIGYYGDRGNEWLKETAQPGTGFLSESTVQWEAATQELSETLNLPSLTVRTGIVLSTRGGALPKMMMPLKLFTSTYFGDGQQWYSWIHIDDLCRIFVRGVADDDFRGTFNGVSPNPVRNKELAATLPKAARQPALVVPAPSLALKTALGEMSHTVLDSTRCSADKLVETGFTFQHPDLLPALTDLLERKG